MEGCFVGCTTGGVDVKTILSKIRNVTCVHCYIIFIAHARKYIYILYSRTPALKLKSIVNIVNIIFGG